MNMATRKDRRRMLNMNTNKVIQLDNCEKCQKLSRGKDLYEIHDSQELFVCKSCLKSYLDKHNLASMAQFTEIEDYRF